MAPVGAITPFFNLFGAEPTFITPFFNLFGAKPTFMTPFFNPLGAESLFFNSPKVTAYFYEFAKGDSLFL